MALASRLGVLFLTLLSVACAAAASPLQTTSRRDEQATISPLTQPQIVSFAPYSFFAATAYCPPRTTVNWSCGHDCQGNPNFQTVDAGGDGALIQFWYVGYDPDLEEVIVAHQGTDLLAIIPLLTDADFLPLPLSSDLFPGVPPSVLVHNGFSDAQAATSTSILNAVQTTMEQFRTSKVTTVGHSLGAGISLLDAIFLHLQIPDATVRFVGFGSPRVGDDPFVNWVDTLGIQVNHISNKKDLVTILPLFLLGYRHISGEIHINEQSQWNDCPVGHDNPSTKCEVGDTDLLLNFNLVDHAGPYDGVLMGCVL
ncbi:lipase [Fomes fomentarius]|nr:lipase [Fomes fomentarius]KAI0788162.1 lipase [Fomes fomentarius]